MMMNVLRVVLILMAIILIAVCTISSSKSQSNAGSAFGGASNDNYFSKNKNQGKDAKMNMFMKVSCVIFIVLSIVMVVLQ